MPTVLVWESELQAEMWDNEILGGLVPTLFAEDIDTARTSFLADKKKAHADLLKMERLLFMPETISLEEAKAVVKKPR